MAQIKGDTGKLMSEPLTKTILISGIGFSDPFVNQEDCRYGPCLSVALKYKPEKIYLITSKKIKESGRYDALLEELSFYLPDTVVELLNNKIFEGNPADMKDVLDFTKEGVIKTVSSDKDNKFLFNISSSTTQMKFALKVLGKLQLKDCKIIQSRRERKAMPEAEKNDWHNYFLNKEVASRDINFSNEVFEVTETDRDVHYFAFVSSIDSLIGKYEYFAAKEFAETFNKTYVLFEQKKLNKLISCLEALHELKELNIEEVKSILGRSSLKFLSRKEKDVVTMYLLSKENISKTRINIGIKVSEIEIAKQNYTNTIKSVALLRELVLLKVVESISKGKHYKTLTRKSLKEVNPKLLDYLDEEAKKTKALEGITELPLESCEFRDQSKLTPWTASKIIKFAIEKENKHKELIPLINENAETLVKKRNAISHEFKRVSVDDFKNAKRVLRDLLKIGKEFKILESGFPEIFKIFNQRLKEFVRVL